MIKVTYIDSDGIEGTETVETQREADELADMISQQGDTVVSIEYEGKAVASKLNSLFGC